MKIAHVVSTLPPDVGGMGRVAYEEARELAARGHAVTVFTLARFGENYYEYDSTLPFRVVRLTPLIRWGDGGIVLQLVWRLKQFDVVHVHYPFYGGVFFILLAHILYGVRYMVTYHMDARPMGRLKQLLKRVADVWSPFLLRSARQVLAVDANYIVYADYAKKIAAERLHIIEPGVDEKIFSPGEKNSELVRSLNVADKRVLLFVGNPIPLKRLDIFLGAMVLLPADVVAVVVGGGYMLDECKKLAQTLGVAKRVRFVGRVINQTDVATYYRLADVVVVPSETESFSLVVVEAQAVGVPVVAADVVGMRGRIHDGETGFLVKPGSIADLHGGIERCLGLTPAQRQRLIDNARTVVGEKYSWPIHVDRLLKVYDRI